MNLNQCGTFVLLDFIDRCATVNVYDLGSFCLLCIHRCDVLPFIQIEQTEWFKYFLTLAVLLLVSLESLFYLI